MTDDQLTEKVSNLPPAKLGASLSAVLKLVRQVRDQVTAAQSTEIRSLNATIERLHAEKAETEQRVRRETLEWAVKVWGCDARCLTTPFGQEPKL